MDRRSFLKIVGLGFLSLAAAKLPQNEHAKNVSLRTDKPIYIKAKPIYKEVI